MPQNSARACVCVCVSVHMLERLIMQTLCYSCYVQLFQHMHTQAHAHASTRTILWHSGSIWAMLCSSVAILGIWVFLCVSLCVGPTCLCIYIYKSRMALDE